MSADVPEHETSARRWSTLQSPRSDQFAHWRELICEAFLHLTPESDRRDGFVGEVTQWQLGDLSIGEIHSQAQHVHRTPRDILRAPYSGYYANLQVQGTSTMTQGGRSTVLSPGDLALVDTTEPFSFNFRDDFRQLTFYLPKALFDAQLDTPLRTATRINTASGVGASVRHAFGTLAGGPLRPDTANRLAVYACGLLAVAMAEPADPHATAHRHQHLYAAAVADIEEHLTDDDLSPPATARRLAVSVRLLHAVFAAQERSFAAEVRRRRLELAARDLRDPARSHLRVIDVAVAAGFTNVASFHRAFRRQFGRTPTEARHHACRSRA